jgi:hypothetical protein
MAMFLLSPTMVQRSLSAFVGTKFSELGTFKIKIPQRTVTHAKIQTYVIFKYHKDPKFCFFIPNFMCSLKIIFK